MGLLFCEKIDEEANDCPIERPNCCMVNNRTDSVEAQFHRPDQQVGFFGVLVYFFLGFLKSLWDFTWKILIIQ